MSHLTYYAYKGFGERQAQKFRYSQAVRVGDRIECAGQGKSIYQPDHSFRNRYANKPRRLESGKR